MTQVIAKNGILINVKLKLINMELNEKIDYYGIYEITDIKPRNRRQMNIGLEIGLKLL
jgi:hypothetical protein